MDAADFAARLRAAASSIVAFNGGALEVKLLLEPGAVSGIDVVLMVEPTLVDPAPGAANAGAGLLGAALVGLGVTDAFGMATRVDVARVLTGVAALPTALAFAGAIAFVGAFGSGFAACLGFTIGLAAGFAVAFVAALPGVFKGDFAACFTAAFVGAFTGNFAATFAGTFAATFAGAFAVTFPLAIAAFLAGAAFLAAVGASFPPCATGRSAAGVTGKCLLMAALLWGVVPLWASAAIEPGFLTLMATLFTGRFAAEPGRDSIGLWVRKPSLWRNVEIMVKGFHSRCGKRSNGALG